MGLELISEHLNGLCLFKPQVYCDERGFFMESFRADDFEKMGLASNFVQDNHSRSSLGVLRGLHFQYDKPQGKLIRVTVGKAFIVEVDIRKNSPTFGSCFYTELSAENMNILWVPPGFANGFCAISQWVEMQYKCTAVWNPKGESSIRWNSPELDIPWPIKNPVLSEKDKNAQSLSQWLDKEEANILKL